MCIYFTVLAKIQGGQGNRLVAQAHELKSLSASTPQTGQIYGYEAHPQELPTLIIIFNFELILNYLKPLSS